MSPSLAGTLTVSAAAPRRTPASARTIALISAVVLTFAVTAGATASVAVSAAVVLTDAVCAGTALLLARPNKSVGYVLCWNQVLTVNLAAQNIALAPFALQTDWARNI